MESVGERIPVSSLITRSALSVETRHARLPVVNDDDRSSQTVFRYFGLTYLLSVFDPY